MCVQLENTKATPHATPKHARPARTVPYRTNVQVQALVRAFERGTLPRAEWTHEAHLIVALDHARRFRPGEAVASLRDAIKRYNKATGTPETATRGYHETITLAWFHLVREALEVFDDGRSLAGLADVVIELYGKKDALFLHYSRERLLSAEARKGWVEPDLSPLPLLAEQRAENRWLVALDARAAALPVAAPADVVKVA